MLNAEARREKTLDLLKRDKEIRVADLKNIFKVSGVTIRNDLLYLEKKGYIQRDFGKAVFKDENISDIFDESAVGNINEKKRIGAYAASLTKENDSIMLYTGTTAYQLAKNLKDFKSLNVVTNSLMIAYEAGKNRYIKTILLGGYYNPDTYAMFGQQAVKQLDEYRVDKLFLSVDGISASDGATTEHPYETEINKAMIRKADQVIVISDYSKIGIARFIKIASLDDIDMLITDDKAPKDEIERMEDKGLKVVVV